MKKFGIALAMLALVAGQAIAADTVSLSVTATPYCFRINKPITTTWQNTSGSPIEVTRFDVQSGLEADGTVILYRVNAGITNAMGTATLTGGVGSATSSTIVYAGTANATNGNLQADTILFGGTATNYIVYVQGWKLKPSL